MNRKGQGWEILFIVLIVLAVFGAVSIAYFATTQTQGIRECKVKCARSGLEFQESVYLNGSNKCLCESELTDVVIIE